MGRVRDRLALYADAVRRMRGRQILWRLRRVIPLTLLAAGTRVPDLEPRLVAAGLGRSGAPQSGPAEPAHERGRFEAYGRSREFGQPGFWDDRGDGLLLLFHLHGFTALAEYSSENRTPEGDAFWARVVEDWLARWERPRQPAWHPYPSSLRIISWSAALSAIHEWPAGLRAAVAGEIVREARYLRRAVEHDLGGNHVIKNATALVFAGALFPSTHLLDAALRLLERETAVQVLADGGHEERSTSYHREVMTDLEDVQELLRRSDLEVPKWLDARHARMARWLEAVAGPDGRLPLLNDAWEGRPVERRTPEPVSVLSDTGYVVLRHEADQLVFDVGALCPANLPPHAHADALSVVLWLDGRPVIVDPGSYCYSGPERNRFRSTSAHATVCIDDEDQCVFWGDFRAARLPHVECAGPWHDGPVTLVMGWHDGYGRLDDSVVHERTVAWWPGQGLAVLDRLRCRQAHTVTSALPCAPGLDPGEERRLGPATVASIGGGAVEIARSEYSPRLGIRWPASALVDRRPTTGPDEVFGWSIFRDGGRVLSATSEQVVVEAAAESHAFTAFPTCG